VNTQTTVAQPLRRHLALRRPSRTEIASRRPIVLTQRDEQILVALHQHGFLTTSLVELAFFPPPPGGRVSHSSCAYDRLDLLWRWRFVDRIELPVSRLIGGSRPYLYALGERGVPVVDRLLPPDAPPARRRRLDRTVELFVDHELTIAKLWANLTAHLRGSGIRLTWWPERLLRGRKLKVAVPGQRWKVPVLPDAAVRLDYPGGESQCCLVEVDMGTLTRARFRRKVQAFELAREAGLFRWLWEADDVEVVVLTHSAARRQNPAGRGPRGGPRRPLARLPLRDLRRARARRLRRPQLAVARRGRPAGAAALRRRLPPRRRRMTRRPDDAHRPATRARVRRSLPTEDDSMAKHDRGEQTRARTRHRSWQRRAVAATDEEIASRDAERLGRLRPDARERVLLLTAQLPALPLEVLALLMADSDGPGLAGAARQLDGLERDGLVRSLHVIGPGDSRPHSVILTERGTAELARASAPTRTPSSPATGSTASASARGSAARPRRCRGTRCSARSPPAAGTRRRCC
jgi:hypothetical protein